eukprot:2417499-Pleurochrysis_carterae.AAC.3
MSDACHALSKYFRDSVNAGRRIPKWEVPADAARGAVEDSINPGQWKPGTFADAGHPNDLGHRLMFSAVDTTLFHPVKLPYSLKSGESILRHSLTSPCLDGTTCTVVHVYVLARLESQWHCFDGRSLKIVSLISPTVQQIGQSDSVDNSALPVGLHSGTSRPVGLALYGCSNRKSGVSPEAEPSRIDAPTRGVVNI